MMESKLDRVQAHKERMLYSIVRRLEQCQATAIMYGIVRAEAALSVCLAALTEDRTRSNELKDIAEETFAEARDLAEAGARKAGAK